MVATTYVGDQTNFMYFIKFLTSSLIKLDLVVVADDNDETS